MKRKGPNPIHEAENEAESLANEPATPNPSDIHHAKVHVSCCLLALFQSYGLHIMAIVKVQASHGLSQPDYPVSYCVSVDHKVPWSMHCRADSLLDYGDKLQLVSVAIMGSVCGFLASIAVLLHMCLTACLRLSSGVCWIVKFVQQNDWK